MNIPKLGETLAEIQDKLTQELEATNAARTEIAGALRDFKSELTSLVTARIDAMARNIDFDMCGRTAALEDIINGPQQKPELEKAA